MAIEQDYVSRAEKVMESIRVKNKWGVYEFKLTTSKIRNILTLVNQIYNDVVLTKDKVLSQEMQARIKYLKVRIVYEAGRDTDREKPVRGFVEKAKLLEEIDEIGDSREKFLQFSKYMEALVAYHRYLGGRD